MKVKQANKIGLVACAFWMLLTFNCVSVTGKRRAKAGRQAAKADIYAQSVIQNDGTVGRSLAAVIRVPREEPFSFDGVEEVKAAEDLPQKDEPDSGKQMYFQ